MSGGHFDYQQYTLREIADTIERDIARAMAPKPPKRHEDYWTIYEMTRPFSYHSLHNAFQEFDSYDKALKYLNAMEDVIKVAKEYECWRLLEEEVLFESTRRKMMDTFEGTEIPILYSIRHCVYDHYPYDLNVLELEDKTIETMKEAYRQIRIAEIYAQRVDWMMSGDDCEDTLQRRLQEDLTKFEEEYASKKWYYPDTEEN
jgi:hypothetical protein